MQAMQENTKREQTVKIPVHRTRFLRKSFMLIVVIFNDGHITHNRFKQNILL